MKYELDPRTGMMKPKVDPQTEITNALRRANPSDKWNNVRHPREQIIIADNHLIVCINCEWRDCGIIANLSAINRYISGPIVNFYNAWRNGIKVDRPTNEK